jgi:hypothetical protein
MMQNLPRLQLIAPKQIRLLSAQTVGLEPFKKGDVITVEEFHAETMIEKGFAETVKDSEKLDSINRWEQVKDKTTKKQEALNEALTAAADEPGAQKAKSPTVKSEEPLQPVDADKAGVSTSTRVNRSTPQ